MYRCLGILLAFAAAALRVCACPVGDTAAAPGIAITEAPPDCCYGAWAGSVHGTAWNVDTDSVAVVLYAQTDQYYVQPFVDSRLTLDCAGRWSTATRGGGRYCALLVRAGYRPPATLPGLPPVGGSVLAVACAPEAQRRIVFAGRTWVVKATGGLPFGPGANLWSDDPESVWVDADGKLHLRIVLRDGWYAAEVFTEEYLGYGRYRFEVEGRVDQLDANAVFAGFVYSDAGDEFDVEFARWGDPGREDNAQYAVQPDRVQRLRLDLDAGASVHEMLWESGRITFTSRAGRLAAPGPTLATWSAAGVIPEPDVERMRFNLWLLEGREPQGAGPVEVVVAGFDFETPTDAATARPIALRVANPARLPLAVAVDLPHPAEVAMRVHDARGRAVGAPFTAALAPGRQCLLWNPGALPAGVYFLTLAAPGGLATSKITLVR